jgi:hypothetical protein
LDKRGEPREMNQAIVEIVRAHRKFSDLDPHVMPKEELELQLPSIVVEDCQLIQERNGRRFFGSHLLKSSVQTLSQE